nr:MAG TPA: hypothetical protein [Caudoviricetes sp.]
MRSNLNGITCAIYTIFAGFAICVGIRGCCK